MLRFDVEDRLREIAADIAANEPLWEKYASYCSLRATGLRKQALGEIDDFSKAAYEWSFDEKRRFTVWLTNTSDGFFASNWFIPHTLLKDLIRPTLYEWTRHEPLNAEPHFLLGLYYVTNDGDRLSHFRCAIYLNHLHQRARQEIVTLILSDIAYAQHHLPEHYIGQPQEDLTALKEARCLLLEIDDESWRSTHHQKIIEYETIIHNWTDRNHE